MPPGRRPLGILAKTAESTGQGAVQASEQKNQGKLRDEPGMNPPPDFVPKKPKLVTPGSKESLRFGSRGGKKRKTRRKPSVGATT